VTPEQTALAFSAAAAFVAAIAAIVSAVMAVLAWRAQRWAQRPHAEVRHTLVLPAWPTGPGPEWFLAEVTNTGAMPFTVESVSIAVRSETGDPWTVPFMQSPGWGDSLPRPLAPGEKAQLWFGESREVQAEFDEKRATLDRVEVGTSLGRFHGPRIDRGAIRRSAGRSD
jgi:hypothetical protein